MTKLHQLHKLGQSTWLNYFRRSFMQSGQLRQQLEAGIQGITANAENFEKTIISCTDYDQSIRREVAAGVPAKRIQETLMSEDAQIAADFLHMIHQESNRLDGFVSQELDPALTHNKAQTVAAVRHLASQSDRGNIMVEVPATPPGLEAVTALIGDGQSVNITHIFSIDDYERAAQAYISGLEYLFRTNSMWRFTPMAVASFSVSPIDTVVDQLLLDLGYPELQGKTGISLAKLLYARFREIFSGPRWQKLARRGACVLRPKWTRTAPQNFIYPDTYYVEALIGPDSVMTFLPVTLQAFLDHGNVSLTLSEGRAEAEAHLERVAELGIDLDAVTSKLQKDYLIASEKQFQSITQLIGLKREKLEDEWHPLETTLGTFTDEVNETLQSLSEHQIIDRIWQQDVTVWPEDGDIRRSLGWLHVTAVMEENIRSLQTFTKSVLAEGFTQALYLGTGGADRAAALMHNLFGKPAQPPNMPFTYLDLTAVDSRDQQAVKNVELPKDISRTLFIVAANGMNDSKATLSAFNHFYQQVVTAVGEEMAGKQFVAISPPHNPLIEVARQNNFRQVFLNEARVHSGFAALSYTGLLPAALAGADLEMLLARAAAMATNTETGHSQMIQCNLGAQLGANLGCLIKHGHNRIIFITAYALAGFVDWLETIISEPGNGLVSCLNEMVGSPENSGPDQIFVQLRLEGDTRHDTAVQNLRDAGFPVLQLHLVDLYDVGGQIFLWQMATAVAGHVLEINPFAQPILTAANENGFAQLEREPFPMTA